VAQNARLRDATNRVVHPALANGSAGAVITQDSDPFAVIAFTIADDLMFQIDIVGDPQRIARLAALVLCAQD